MAKPIEGGGHGGIFKATHGERVLAVKILYAKPNNEDPEEVKKHLSLLYRELIIWWTLDHPYILPMYGVDDLEGETRAAFPYLERGRISDYALLIEKQGKKAPLDEWMLQLVEAVGYLHGLQIVHGDLHVGNILIGDDERVKLVDFGRSKYCDSNQLTENSLMSMGGLCQAPELALADVNKGVRPTVESDIFSFAFTWLELYSRRTPYYPKNPRTLCNSYKNKEKPKWPENGLKSPHSQAKLEGLPVWKVMRRCFDVSPTSRPKLGEIESALRSNNQYWIRQAYTEPSAY
ncbi:kinase-like protein [Panus rudis PR-1116 ss-1]|nr:kinase-like protein [Panus rudis PR-1116 ss-1]